MAKFPDLSDSKALAIDIETYDPKLKTEGNGVYRKDGWIVGISLANDKGFAEYYDIRHPNPKEHDPEKVLGYIKKQLALPCTKVTANGMYDFDWLINGYGMEINGPWKDVLIAEPLIDEEAKGRYSLDAVSLKYLNKQKQKGKMERFCAEWDLKGDVRKHIWRMDYETVYDYGIADAVLPIQVLVEQWKIIKQENLEEVFDLEMRLQPLLLQMKRQGVRIDEDRVQELIDVYREDLKIAKAKLFDIADGTFNYNSGDQTGKIFDALGIEYPLTEKSRKPSITAGYLREVEHPIASLILQCKQTQKMIDTFFIGSFQEKSIDGRIHAKFNQLATDDYGTVSGRFSSSLPNLQQVPKRSERFGKICREMFIPEEDHLWASLDYSQIEVRILAHYAEGKGAQEIVDAFIENPYMDYHQWCAEMSGLSRINAKTLNFGVMYGMGLIKMSASLGFSETQARDVRGKYYDKLPFIPITRNHVSEVAERRGYIRMLSGRRRRLYDKSKSYKFLNSLVQGSAADYMKKAMVDAYEAGIYNILVPHLTVHDEMNQSVPKTLEGFEAVKELKNIMEHAYEIKVPMIADTDIGINWGNTEKFKENNIEIYYA